jgi:hypothetical protein
MCWNCSINEMKETVPHRNEAEIKQVLAELIDTSLRVFISHLNDKVAIEMGSKMDKFIREKNHELTFENMVGLFEYLVFNADDPMLVMAMSTYSEEYLKLTILKSKAIL